ncbi:MAG: helix-turn-helix domain-containing protein [Halobacteriales archaeon]
MSTPQPSESLPTDLSVPRHKLVYLYLRENGETDIDDLRETLNVSLLDLYPTLDSLEEKELVERQGEEVRLRTDD